MGISELTSRRAVFLDRDGVLNAAIVRSGKPYSPASVDALRLLPGVAEACDLLRKAGFLLIMVTNQPDVARGISTREAVEAINSEIRRNIALDDVRVCYHDDADECDCRKPKPGLLVDAARTWNIDLTQSYIVGDRYKDTDAGHQAGCTTVLVDNHYYAETASCEPDVRVASLKEAAEWILNRMVKKGETN